MVGPLTPYSNVDVQAVSAAVRVGPGVIGSYYFFNQASSTRYVKFYDKASPVNAATDVPFATYPVPAGSGANLEISGGIQFSLGLYIRATQLIGYTDNTAPAVNDVIANLGLW